MYPTRTRAAALAACLASLALATSCQQFFTSSLAAYLARDSYTIPADLPVDDAIELLEAAMAQGDSATAAALVKPLLAAATAAASDPTSEDYNEAATALASAVVLSSGVGTAVTSMAQLFLAADEETDEAAMMETIADTISSVTLSSTEVEALSLIAENPPAGLGADDAYAAAVALVSNAFATTETDINDIGSLTAEQTDAIAADPSMIAALSLIEYAGTVDGGESLIGSLLGGFDLSSFETTP